MTPEQQELVFRMALVPGRGRALSPDEFVTRTKIQNPCEWALGEIEDAIRRQDRDDAEAALLVSAVFGGTDQRWTSVYRQLLSSDWHVLHEDAAQSLGQLGDAEDVPALIHATHHVPAYLEFDEARALASKAIHSLGKIPGPEADAALEDLQLHEDHVLRATAGRVLARRRLRPPPLDRARVVVEPNH